MRRPSQQLRFNPANTILRQKLVRHLVSSEAPMSDIIANHASRGEMLLSQLERCHGEDLHAYTESHVERMRTLGKGLDEAEKALSEDNGVLEKGRDGARAGVNWTKEYRKERKELEGCLKGLEDLAEWSLSKAE